MNMRKAFLLRLFFLNALFGHVFIANLCASTDISKDISQNTTWTSVGSPYIINGDITVYTQLTIDPGVVVAFNSGASLTIGRAIWPGAIVAVGNQNQVIRFTSNQASPRAGDWGGISLPFVDASTRTESRFEYCVFEFGGAGRNAMIQVQDSSPIVSHCQISSSSSGGIEVKSMLWQSKPSIVACVILGNRLSGLTLDARSNLATVRDSLFQANRSYPVITNANSMGTLQQNTFVDNTPDAIQVIGDLITATQTVANMGIPYIVSGDEITIYGAEMSIGPGVEFRFQTGTGITTDDYEGGTIRAIGEASNPILFTSSQSSPSPGDWKGVRLLAEQGLLASTLQYCIVEYGGQSGFGEIYISGSHPTITNCSIRRSSNDGINIAAYWTSNPSISQNNIYENYRFDLNNNFSGKITAKNNWWGSATGPQRTNGNIDASNFLTSPILIGFPRSPLLHVFPHFAAGAMWRTLIFLKNLESVPTSVDLSFRNDAGTPQAVTIGGTTSGVFNFDIAASGMLAIEVGGEQLSSGWAEILPRHRVAGSMVFQFVPQGPVLSAGGMPSSEFGQEFAIPFVTTRASNATLAYAIANPNMEAITIKLELFRDNGLRESEATMSLPALGHIARYLDQLFPQAVEWNGFVKLSSELQFCMLPLRFDGSVLSTISVIRLK